MTRWRLPLLILLCCGFLVAALYLLPPRAAERPPLPTELALPTERVVYRSVAIPVRSRGVARPARQIPLISEVGGRVVAVADDFRDGAWVDTETPLVQLEKEPFQLDIQRRRNELRAAELHLARTRANASVARQNNKNSSAYARYEPQMAEARSRVEAARAGLREAQRRLENASVSAPFAGRLQAVTVQAGQYVQAGTRLASLSTARHMEVRLPVRDDWLALLDYPLAPDAELPDIRVVLEGSFAGRRGRWRGQVVRREGGLNANQMVFLVVRVENPASADLPLESGVFLEVELTGPPRQHVAVLPRAVLAGDSAVWVLDDERRLRRRSVQILHRDSQHLYVGGGLEARRQVVRAGGLGLLEGTRVKPLGEAADTALGEPSVPPGGEHVAQH